MRIKLMVATWLAIAAIGAEALCAQQAATATLSGRVMDATGSVIVGAKVAITLAAGPIDSNNLRLEYGPAPNDQRHRFTFSGVFELGVSNVNYSGFSNALVRDSDDPKSPGFLKSSSFGHAVTTAGGVFGSGGPRAFQLAVKIVF
jgi:hypothetical protein